MSATIRTTAGAAHHQCPKRRRYDLRFLPRPGGSITPASLSARVVSIAVMSVSLVQSVGVRLAGCVVEKRSGGWGGNPPHPPEGSAAPGHVHRLEHLVDRLL